MSRIYGRPHSLGRTGSLSLVEFTVEAADQVPGRTDAGTSNQSGWLTVQGHTAGTQVSRPFLHYPTNGYGMGTLAVTSLF